MHSIKGEGNFMTENCIRTHHDDVCTVHAGHERISLLANLPARSSAFFPLWGGAGSNENIARRIFDSSIDVSACGVLVLVIYIGRSSTVKQRAGR